ncbi:MAG: elongation factor P [Candidatus Saganbacteria bacterium]|nr:elongation factor P [Candidatus Saganbacteria bacterium]
MSIAVTELRPGITIELEGQIFQVVEYNHIKMGRGGAIVRVKMKNLDTGNSIERTFKSNDKVERAHIERKQMQFLYSQGGQYHFMDQVTYDQIALTDELMGDAPKYIREGDIVQVVIHNERVMGVDLPSSVTLKVTETGSGFKGDSVSNMMKPATLETGLVTQVPLFVNVENSVVVDTRTGKYVERA